MIIVEADEVYDEATHPATLSVLKSG